MLEKLSNSFPKTRSRMDVYDMGKDTTHSSRGMPSFCLHRKNNSLCLCSFNSSLSAEYAVREPGLPIIVSFVLILVTGVELGQATLPAKEAFKNSFGNFYRTRESIPQLRDRHRDKPRVTSSTRRYRMPDTS